MQFKKGSFEVGSVVYPVAIKVCTTQFVGYHGISYLNSFFFLNSTIPDLQTLSGIPVAIQ